MALANLATATESNRTSVTLLTQTTVGLTSQFTTLTANLSTAQSDNSRVKRSGNCSAPADHIHCSDNLGETSDQNPLRDRNIYSRSGGKFDPNGYYSSHRLKFEESHTSANCRYLVDGHNKFATRLDTKGGKIWNKA